MYNLTAVSKMFTHKIALVAAVSIGASSIALAGADLGREATPEEVAAWDISVAPDGADLPPGSGTVGEGRVVYERKCETCHGKGAVGGEGLADPLVGGAGSLTTDSPTKTVGSFWPHATTLFDYIRRAMPYNEPMSLTDDQVYALCAYILHENEIIDADAVMTADSLPNVAMPNRDGFISYWPEP